MTDGPAGPFRGGGSDGTDGTVRAQYDWSSTTPSIAVAETIAVALDRMVTTLDPLYDFVDPDALDELLRPIASTANGNDTSVSFTIADQQVTVHSGGEVIVRPNPQNK